MSQKFKKIQNSNDESTAYGKWFATAVYDQKFVTTKQLADFIQKQASVKRSDIMAVLDELGDAMKHYFELGQKVKLDGIGIFKVGFSSIGAAGKVDCTAATITTRRVLFQPETERIVVGQALNKEGKIVQKYVVAKTLIKDVFFEETYDPNLKPEGNSDSSEGTDDENTQGGGSGDNTTGDNTQGGDNQQGGGNSSITPGEGD